MNGEPQDSTTSTRPTVEGLRSQSVHYAANLPSDNHESLRPVSRREYSDDGLTSHGSQFGHPRPSQPLPLGPSDLASHSNSPYFRHPSSAFPARTHSLGHNIDELRLEAHRQNAIRLRQQRDGEDTWRKIRGSSSTLPQTMPQIPRRHATSSSMDSEQRRVEFPRPENRYGSMGNHLHSGMRQSGHPQATEHALPKWQPDSDVSECPICHYPFSFFFRKHHCRKCGRVVCANCSPHRITIPRQYIVNPPAPEIAIDLTGDSTNDDESTARLAADQLRPNLSGGQEVRLCNPCVPDPNPLPPPPPYTVASSGPITQPQQINLQRNHSGGIPPSRRRSHGISMMMDYQRYQNQQYQNQQLVNPVIGRRPLLHHSDLNASNQDRITPYGSAPSDLAPYIPQYSHPRNHRHHASLSVLPLARERVMLEAMTCPDPPPEESPRRQIAEEDECPICHEELPPKGPDGSEAAREAHVAACIEGHFSSSRPKDSSMPHPGTAVAAAVVASAATPAQAGSSVPTAIAGPSTRRRTTGMVVYHATEKDCIGEDGAAQECIICFEDFEPGTEMGRLECLCKFHKACIRSWWDTKGVGACPVHQGGLI